MLIISLLNALRKITLYVFWQVGLLAEAKSEVIERIIDFLKKINFTPIQDRRKVEQTAVVRKYIIELLHYILGT
ncbi:MAG TPA: hypothetical protein K8V56_11295 [Sporosarcina psychrophila]|uniref:Uncharacterized protein n=1 Tax=Sporosarcina psychrophila TaxID=1476 RepID=A0A921G0E8_SPOPS|nr:hypothetical protein [Sporosarcina psychrophila]